MDAVRKGTPPTRQLRRNERMASAGRCARRRSFRRTRYSDEGARFTNRSSLTVLPTSGLRLDCTLAFFVPLTSVLLCDTKGFYVLFKTSLSPNHFRRRTQTGQRRGEFNVPIVLEAVLLEIREGYYRRSFSLPHATNVATTRPCGSQSRYPMCPRFPPRDYPQDSSLVHSRRILRTLLVCIPSNLC